LTTASKLKAWIGKYIDLSYFGLDSTYSISIEHYAIDGTLTSTDTAVTAATGMYRLSVLPASTDAKILAKILQAVTIPAGTSWLDYSGGTAFTKNTSTLVGVAPVGSVNFRARTPIPNVDLTNFPAINFSLTLSGTWTGSVTLTVRLCDKTSNYKQIVTSALTANGTTPLSITTVAAVGAQPEIYNDSLIVLIQGTVATGTLTATLTIPNGQVITTILYSQEIEVQDPCTKPVTLSWLNRLGGQDWWTFDYNQDLSYTDENGKRVRRMRLSAQGLTYDQWQMVSYLNQAGEVYDKAYSELNIGVRGKQRMLDTQAYVLLDNYALLEVLVVFSSETTETENNSSSIDITIEFPEGFEDNNFFGLATGRLRPFVVNFTNNLPTNEWEVYWFGSVLQTVKTTASYTRNLQLPTEPTDVIIKVRKKSNNGIAQNNGTISLIKNSSSYPGQNIIFNAGDDMSDLTFTIYAVDANNASPFDQMRIVIVE
jgi:hypothetical protein